MAPKRNILHGTVVVDDDFASTIVQEVYLPLILTSTIIPSIFGDECDAGVLTCNLASNLQIATNVRRPIVLSVPLPSLFKLYERSRLTQFLEKYIIIWTNQIKWPRVVQYIRHHR